MPISNRSKRQWSFDPTTIDTTAITTLEQAVAALTAIVTVLAFINPTYHSENGQGIPSEIADFFTEGPRG